MKHKSVHHSKHVDKKLLFRLKIFAVVFVVMMGIILYDIFQNTITVPIAMGGIGIGILVGLISGRMFNIRWHEEKSQVISHVDELGVVIIILYIAFAVFRKQIFGHWLHGPLLTAFSFSFFAGTMVGRILTTGLSVRKVLHEQGLLK